MAKAIAYEIEVRGIRGVITNQEDLTAAVRETTKAYKAADFGSDEFKKSEKELASLKTLQSKFRQDVRDTAREQTVAADKGKGSYRALNAELVNLRRSYKELSAADRQAFGPDLLGRIQKLDNELKDIDGSIGQYQRNVGNYRDAFADLGGVDLAALATGPGAILAVGTAALQAGEYIFTMSEEVRELRGELSTLTNETGAELDSFTSRILGISETFGVGTDEITNAANAVSKQLGISFEDALGRIEEGFIAGSNQTDEFLSNLLEYPTQFKAVFGEGEAAADALFNTINKQATDGIFSDKGVDAIKEAGLALRELPQVTRDAIDAIGLDSKELETLIAEEGVGAGIAAISKQLGTLRADSPEVGQALADIFKGAGEDAGIDFVLSLQDIDAATGQLIDRSNEYQLQQEKTLAVNKEFAEAQVEVSNALGGTGNTVDNLFTQLQTFALQLVVPIIGYFQDWFAAVRPVGTALLNLGKAVGLVGEETDGAGIFIKVFTGGLKLALIPIQLVTKALTFAIDKYTQFVEGAKSVGRFLGIISDEVEGGAFGGGGAGGSFAKAADDIDEVAKASGRAADGAKDAATETDDLTKKINSQALAAKRAAAATDSFAKGSIADLRKQVSELKKELDETSPDQSEGVLSKLIDAEQALDKVEKARAELRVQVSRLNDDIRPVSLIAPVDETIAQVQQSQAAISEQQQKFNDELTAKAVANEAARNEKIKQQALADAESRSAAIAEVSAFIFSGIDDVLSSLTEASNTRQANEISALEDRYDREIELAEGNDERQVELREELDAERAAIEQREFERQKRYRTASALASLASGVVNILATPSTIPEPFSAPFKAARIAFLTGTTIAQIANIQSQQAARGVSIDSEGRVRGQLHSGPNSGVDMVLNGQPFKVEDGEIIDGDEFGGVNVVNRRSAASFRPQLRAIRGKNFPGKRDLLSAMNSHKGYGVAFANVGASIRPANASLSAVTGGVGSTQNVVNVVVVDDESINNIASRTAAAVQVGAAAGVANGMNAATRNTNRQSKLQNRTNAA